MGSDFKIDNRIVFYDGFCVVCSKFINLLINSDKNKLNKFKTKKLTNHNGKQIGHIEAHVDF